MQSIGILEETGRIIKTSKSKLNINSKKELYIKWQQSGLSKRAFCKAQLIPISTFLSWCTYFENISKEPALNLYPVNIVESQDVSLNVENFELELLLSNGVVSKIKFEKNQFGFVVKELLNASTTIG